MITVEHHPNINDSSFYSLDSKDKEFVKKVDKVVDLWRSYFVNLPKDSREFVKVKFFYSQKQVNSIVGDTLNFIFNANIPCLQPKIKKVTFEYYSSKKDMVEEYLDVVWIPIKPNWKKPINYFSTNGPKFKTEIEKTRNYEFILELLKTLNPSMSEEEIESRWCVNMDEDYPDDKEVLFGRRTIKTFIPPAEEDRIWWSYFDLVPTNFTDDDFDLLFLNIVKFMNKTPPGVSPQDPQEGTC